MSIKRSGGPTPKPPVQTSNPAQSAQQNIRQQTTQGPTPFEPSRNILAQQSTPALQANQQIQGGFKAGLMPRNAQTGGLDKMMNNVRKALDNFIRNINWRIRPRPPQNTNPTRPPIMQPMYGVTMPGGGDNNVRPPSNPPIMQPMYGVTMPGGGDNNVKPPTTNPPIMQPMYGVTMPGGDDNNNPPIMQPMYGVTMPGLEEQRPPVFQPMYGVTMPSTGNPWSLFSAE